MTKILFNVTVIMGKNVAHWRTRDAMELKTED